VHQVLMWHCAESRSLHGVAGCTHQHTASKLTLSQLMKHSLVCVLKELAPPGDASARGTRSFVPALQLQAACLLPRLFVRVSSVQLSCSMHLITACICTCAGSHIRYLTTI
jgi:hypothetical protein